MIMESSKLNSLTPVKMTLTFTQDHEMTRKLELVQLFFCMIA